MLTRLAQRRFVRLDSKGDAPPVVSYKKLCREYEDAARGRTGTGLRAHTAVSGVRPALLALTADDVPLRLAAGLGVQHRAAAVRQTSQPKHWRFPAEVSSRRLLTALETSRETLRPRYVAACGYLPRLRR